MYVGEFEVIIRAYTDGFRSTRRAIHEATEALLAFRADCSKSHADWFCSLPWYRQWWAMVRGR